MRLEVLRKIIKEEIEKTLNGNTFHNGEIVLHAGQRFTVVNDEGDIGVQVKTESGKTKILNRYQLTRVNKNVEEATFGVNIKNIKSSSVNAIKNIVAKHPEVKSMVDDALAKGGVERLEDLEDKDVLALNSALIQKTGTPRKSSQATRTPSDKPSRGYMGAKYTGD